MDLGLRWLTGGRTVNGGVRSAERYPEPSPRWRGGSPLSGREGRVADPHLCGWCWAVWVAQNLRPGSHGEHSKPKVGTAIE